MSTSLEPVPVMTIELPDVETTTAAPADAGYETAPIVAHTSTSSTRSLSIKTGSPPWFACWYQPVSGNPLTGAQARARAFTVGLTHAHRRPSSDRGARHPTAPTQHTRRCLGTVRDQYAGARREAACGRDLPGAVESAFVRGLRQPRAA